MGYIGFFKQNNTKHIWKVYEMSTMIQLSARVKTLTIDYLCHNFCTFKV